MREGDSRGGEGSRNRTGGMGNEEKEKRMDEPQYSSQIGAYILVYIIIRIICIDVQLHD
jgi:hypothetical protein